MNHRFLSRLSLHISLVSLAAGAAVFLRSRYPLPLKDYTSSCLYMAVLDHEICRRRLEGTSVNGVPVDFPPPREDLHSRYQFFLQSCRGMTASQLDQKIRGLEETRDRELAEPW